MKIGVFERGWHLVFDRLDVCASCRNRMSAFRAKLVRSSSTRGNSGATTTVDRVSSTPSTADAENDDWLFLQALNEFEQQHATTTSRLEQQQQQSNTVCTATTNRQQVSSSYDAASQTRTIITTTPSKRANATAAAASQTIANRYVPLSSTTTPLVPATPTATNCVANVWPPRFSPSPVVANKRQHLSPPTTTKTTATTARRKQATTTTTATTTVINDDFDDFTHDNNNNNDNNNNDNQYSTPPQFNPLIPLHSPPQNNNWPIGYSPSKSTTTTRKSKKTKPKVNLFTGRESVPEPRYATPDADVDRPPPRDDDACRSFIYPTNMQLRNYQLSIVRRALQRNTYAAMLCLLRATTNHCAPPPPPPLV
jgi:hypothetical protein